jgi:orotidine-5'-phosphate decarboxylase
MDRNFRELLEAQWGRKKFVCVGLDSELGKIPLSMHRYEEGHAMSETEKSIKVADTIIAFNRAIVDATYDVAGMYKLQASFYEAEEPDGINAMIDTVAYIHERYPEIPVIKDAKRADIGNTNAGYVRSTFDIEGFDAVTLHPYLGIGALKPFLDRKEKGCIILCRTSNPEAPEFQDLIVKRNGIEMPLWKYVAHQVTEVWNRNGNCCLVVGATYPGEMQEIRAIAGDMPFLIPGIGAQGGDVEKTVKAGQDSRGRGMIINSSRGIIFASKGPDFAEAARRETQKLHDLINQYR